MVVHIFRSQPENHSCILYEVLSPANVKDYGMLFSQYRSNNPLFIVSFLVIWIDVCLLYINNEMTLVSVSSFSINNCLSLPVFLHLKPTLPMTLHSESFSGWNMRNLISYLDLVLCGIHLIVYY
jgi:hypothetical protein